MRRQETLPERETLVCVDCGASFVFEPDERHAKDGSASLYEEYMEGGAFVNNEPLCEPCFSSYEEQGLVTQCSECNIPSIINPEDPADTLAEVGVHDGCWEAKMNNPHT